ncbi:MAG TPA: hypothetical protein ENK86_05930 [Campylobacterales bacterium]|nr:hypothetical protein [Campylobacterales bacterium]
MQRETISFDIVNPNRALLAQLRTILSPFKQVENITLSNDQILLNEFQSSMRDVNRLKNGDRDMLYGGSLDDMLQELK